MKRGKDFRNAIKAPEGYTLCEFDASGQEFRWMAIASEDTTMLELCQPGEDPHGFMGAQVSGQDYRELVRLVHDGDKVAKDSRQLGKVANLSLQYRTSAKKLMSVARVQYSLPMDLDQAQVIRKTYLTSYPDVPKYWDRQIQICSKLKYVETFAGRRVQLLDDFNGKNGWSLASTTINYRIQGTGADQKYLALMVLKPYMLKHGIRFAWELHDGVYLYIPDNKVSQCVPEIRRLLANLPYQKAWGFTPPIPLPWDAKTGQRWGDLKEYEDG
jgi:DNA polymerase I-like protein with 3'-5' exonuclease and polymerase domains